MELHKSVQKRVLKITSGLHSTLYLDQLKEVDFTTLEERRVRGDLIQTWKILHKHDNLKEGTWLTRSVDTAQRRVSTCNINMNLNSNLDIRINFFSWRVIKRCNSLPVHWLVLRIYMTNIFLQFDTGCPIKHGNSVTNSISSLLWISIVIPNSKSHNIIMSARVYFMITVNGCKDVFICLRKFTLFVYCNFLVLQSTTVCSQNINKQIVNIADENLTGYSFLSRYHYSKSKNYLKRRYRICHWISMFIGTPCTYQCFIILKT